MSGTIGAAVIYASNNFPSPSDRTRLLKYPRNNNSSSTITTANYYPVNLDGGFNKHVSVVQSEDAYYFTIGASSSNNLQVRKLPYRNISSTVTPYNVLNLNHISGQPASSTMWVDNFNDLFISHGDLILKVFASSPAKTTWADSAFNLNNTQIYYVPSPYIIERAIVNIETGKHYALCSKNTTGYTVDTTLYMCEITFAFGTPFNIASVTELSPIPVAIIDTDNKHINIPTYGNYIIVTSTEGSKAVFDLVTFTWQPLNAVIDLQNTVLNRSNNIRVHSVTQPTFRSAFNFLTVEFNGEYIIYQLTPLLFN
ncbi:MAG: hypothetical protein RLZZ171_1196 [Cyanobacteriota bacterium]